MKITVDRIEGNYAVCFNNNHEQIDIPVSFFSSPLKEGLIFDITFTELKDEEEIVHERISKKASQLWVD